MWATNDGGFRRLKMPSGLPQKLLFQNNTAMYDHPREESVVRPRRVKPSRRGEQEIKERTSTQDENRYQYTHVLTKFFSLPPQKSNIRKDMQSLFLMI